MPASPVSELCPLCSAPLREQQDWCLRCGAAARTRLAAPAKWRAPIAIAAVIIVLSLAVLGAALVKLSEKKSTTPGGVQTPAALSTTPPVSATPLPTQTAITPTATTPLAQPQSTTPTATGATGAKGATQPPSSGVLGHPNGTLTAKP